MRIGPLPVGLGSSRAVHRGCAVDGSHVEGDGDGPSMSGRMRSPSLAVDERFGGRHRCIPTLPHASTVSPYKVVLGVEAGMSCEVD